LEEFDESIEKLDRKAKLSEILSVIKPYKKRWFLALGLTLIEVVLFIQFPLILQIMTKAILERSKEDLINGFLYLLAIFIGLSIVIHLRLKHGNFYISLNIVKDLKRQLAEKILSQSFHFVDHQETGDLVSTITKDVNMVDEFVSHQLLFLTRVVLQFFGVSFMLFLISPELLFLEMIVFPFLIIAVYIYTQKIHPITYQQRTILGKLTSRLQENISGIHMVRAFANEEHEFFKFDKINTTYADSSKQVGKISSYLHPVITMLVELGRVIVVGAGGYMVLTGIQGFWGNTLSLDQVIAFVAAMDMFMFPVIYASWLAGEYGRIQAGYDRVRKVMGVDQDIKDSPDAIELSEIKGEITFKNISFSYVEGHKVLSNISFNVPAGSTVALLGSTGSGKSTIVNLLARLYEIDEGEILIDQKWNIKDITLDSLRNQIGMVAQDPFLFQLSFVDNLTHGLSKWTMDEVIEACKVAEIHEFIMSKDDQYETIIGERGVTVSGGQKQRLTIARAILRKPRILILDDATSSVDVDTEYDILMKLKNIFHTCTTFIITQRLSTVRNADVIYVFEDGEIIESGNHTELLAIKGIYTQLYQTISRGNFIE
jgi:ABC-type multidrug transport system fused ATPase/permease subunit